jgi:hypothetical protein
VFSLFPRVVEATRTTPYNQYDRSLMGDSASSGQRLRCFTMPSGHAPLDSKRYASLASRLFVIRSEVDSMRAIYGMQCD